MGLTTRFGLHSQTTRLLDGLARTAPHSPTGLSPSLVSPSRELGPCRRLARPPQTTTRLRDSKSELFPLRSPLLGESLLVSFPPLTDMLKFSGSSCLSVGLVCMYGISLSGQCNVQQLQTPQYIAHFRAPQRPTSLVLFRTDRHAPKGASCVQRFDDSQAVHFPLHFALYCVLHRCKSQEIHC